MGGSEFSHCENRAKALGTTKLMDFVHQWTKLKNLVIPSVIHHRQNPLESTRAKADYSVTCTES
jgi:hypothetical protein